ncbi:hypothetical protein [Streptomonospora salina]|uniref:Uncharacterized protein n=1 Tax=Streptomonospora salina TaxID=104205 RepID=A0A841E7K0_9ACTN|nr:hypothetical protein [Streptomonospora salina]MBB5998986.1 hypothetical protein [Streptomonospora salina]
MLGNATLLGVGYLLLRRPRLAALALAVSAGLLTLTALYPAFLVWRFLLVAWWLTLVIHTWRTAPPAPREPPEPRSRWNPLWRRRVLLAACLLLVAFGWLRFDTWTVVHYAEDAHAAGECDRAVDSLWSIGPIHGAAYGSAAERGEAERTACERLLTALDAGDAATAATKLGAYLERPDARWDGAGPKRAEFLLDVAMQNDGEEFRGDDDPALAATEAAFTQLSDTLQDTPGQSGRVRAVTESFIASLAETPPCKAKAIDNWMLDQDWQNPELAEPVASEADRVPGRMFDCAESFGVTDPDAAGAAYQAYLKAYPEHESAADAAEALLSDEQYCEHPAAYPGAPAYKGDGPHAMQTFGIDAAQYGFPDSWQADGAAETVLVTCVEGPERGSRQETCYYSAGADQPLVTQQGNAEVDFFASEFSVTAYSLRTGKPVNDYSEEIGDPCPPVLEYESSTYLDLGPPSDYDSDYSDADVRGIFDRLMD